MLLCSQPSCGLYQEKRVLFAFWSHGVYETKRVHLILVNEEFAIRLRSSPKSSMNIRQANSRKFLQNSFQFSSKIGKLSSPRCASNNPSRPLFCSPLIFTTFRQYLCFLHCSAHGGLGSVFVLSTEYEMCCCVRGCFFWQLSCLACSTSSSYALYSALSTMPAKSLLSGHLWLSTCSGSSALSPTTASNFTTSTTSLCSRSMRTTLHLPLSKII